MKASAAAGWLALALLVLLGGGSVLAVAVAGSDGGGLPAGSAAAVRFTLLQAALSAAISAALAVPLARALARCSFPGRELLVVLTGAAFLLPALVAVLGILGIFGRNGPVSAAMVSLGFAPLDIFGLPGVLMVHVFFNLPLVTRMLLQGWAAIPPEQFRLAEQLGFGRGAMFRLLEWPMLRQVLPGAFLLVFLLCSTSFAVVLALGGGPAATTVELAIYQALRFDFDLGAAARLAMVQALIGGAAALLAGWFQGAPNVAPSLSRRPVAPGGAARLADGGRIALAALFLLAPVAVVLARGIGPLLSGLPASTWPAAARSLAVAVVSSALALALALALAGLIDRAKARGSRLAAFLETAGYLPLAISPLVTGTGLFILINPWTDPFALALPVTATVNASLSVPLALRLLLPAFTRARQRYGRLAASLDLQGWQHFRLVTWPEIRPAAMFAAAISAALSMGDLGVVALFAPPGTGTLPLVMQRLMASYQMDAAAGVALLMMLLSLALFWIIGRGGLNAH